MNRTIAGRHGILPAECDAALKRQKTTVRQLSVHDPYCWRMGRCEVNFGAGDFDTVARLAERSGLSLEEAAPRAVHLLAYRLRRPELPLEVFEICAAQLFPPQTENGRTFARLENDAFSLLQFPAENIDLAIFKAVAPRMGLTAADLVRASGAFAASLLSLEVTLPGTVQLFPSRLGFMGKPSPLDPASPG